MIAVEGTDPDPGAPDVPDAHPASPHEVEIDVADFVPSRRPGPAELRQALAAGLHTTAPDVLDDAARDFRGVFGDPMDYIREQLLEFLPPRVSWVLTCCENDRLRHAYEAGKTLVWTLPHPDDPRKLLIFESPRAKFRSSRR